MRRPARAAQTIREALAKGADRAIHIEAEDAGAFDPLGTARLLAAALAGESPDLILTGLQSDDLGYGQTGVILAELLGLPHATIIMQVEKPDGGIRVKRELEDGWFQHVEMPLPALLTIQSGISKLRYATLMGIKKAKSKEVRRLPAAGLATAGAPTVTLDRVYLPERTKRTQLFEGSPKEAAAEAGGKTEIRGARPMSILAVLEQRDGQPGIACRGRRWRPRSRLPRNSAPRFGRRGALGRTIRRRRAGGTSGSTRLRRRARAAASTRRMATRRPCAQLIDAPSAAAACSSRTPTRCAISCPSWRLHSAKWR